jgi:SAM-dependent methyltransferase
MTGMVYDFGCGVRPFEADILQHAKCYIGIDWSNSLHGLRADIEADLNRPLPISDGVADTVVSFEVLEHLAEPETMLREAFRILHSDGRIFLSAPFQWWLHEVPWDYFRYTRYGLEHLLRKVGFVDIDVEAVSGFWSMWFLKFNYQTARLLRGPKPVQWVVRGVLTPVWWINQTIAPFLDRLWPAQEETTGYFASARKP